MSTLVEFLLARIADDQEAAEAAWLLVAGSPRRGGKTTARRQLAECEAKRRIIALHDRWHVCVNSDGIGGTDYGDEMLGFDYENCPTILALAAPFSDHAGFDPVWLSGSGEVQE